LLILAAIFLPRQKRGVCFDNAITLDHNCQQRALSLRTRMVEVLIWKGVNFSGRWPCGRQGSV
jgi:hypothetical protein